MRLSTSLVPTLREEPAEAEALSHKLMLRAGLVRQLAAGVFVWLPLGQRVLDKITAIIREEMNAIGGQEITMPVIHPAEIWKQSGRWDGIPEMFKLKDRHGREMCLGMTHEEVIAWLAAREIKSYRDLPQIWYQIQTKERDEARPRSGVLRTREFLMKDSYTLDPDQAALDVSYNAHKQAYGKIFDRCGLRYVVVDSDPGMMGGSGSHEFMAPSAAGEDEVALCAGCDYAANVELARRTVGGRGAARSRHARIPDHRRGGGAAPDRPRRHDQEPALHGGRHTRSRPRTRRPQSPRAQARACARRRAPPGASRGGARASRGVRGLG